MHCHPRLPLVAWLDAGRPAVHVWDYSTGELREVSTIGGDSRAYGDGHWWAPRNPEFAVILDREERRPSVTWHPEQPLLLAAIEGTVTRWTPGEISTLDGLPPGAAYRDLAFSPDGQTLWASPSADPTKNPNSWEYSSDAIDLGSTAVTAGRWWDTGVAVHPGGGLVATLSSDQGATHVLFARADQESTPSAMRVLRRALILGADGYETPVISADGRYLAIRGNAYENSLEVFKFPSLTRVLAMVLGESHRSGKFDPDWDRQYRAWSRQNIAFANQSGLLWIGGPDGTLAEIDLDRQHAARHEVLDGSRVTALCTTAAGDLVVATGEGDLVLVSVRTEFAQADAAGHPTPQALVTAFLQATSEAPDDSDLEDHLVVSDGARTWEPGDLNAMTTATETDPTWLQHRAAINKLFAQEK